MIYFIIILLFNPVSSMWPRFFKFPPKIYNDFSWLPWMLRARQCQTIMNENTEVTEKWGKEKQELCFRVTMKMKLWEKNRHLLVINYT